MSPKNLVRSRVPNSIVAESFAAEFVFLRSTEKTGYSNVGTSLLKNVGSSSIAVSKSALPHQYTKSSHETDLGSRTSPK